ncbi:MAG: MerR family transcriptional regulator [Planctomycetota bacterium]
MGGENAAENAGFTISELAAEAGVEPRTIRSYVEKGIIPGPDSLGRGARYPQDALDRLKVLTLLRDANRSLTLDQIRILLQKLGPSELRGLADGRLRIGAVLDTDAVGEPPRTAAMDYLAMIRSDLSPSVTAKNYAADPCYRPTDYDDELPVLEEAARALVKLAGLTTASRGVRGEHWYRLPLTPDIELSVRGSFGSDQLAQLHRIGDALRLLLTKGPRK